MSQPAESPPRGPGAGRRGEAPQNIATAIAEVSERATDLVHEEIELLKAELSEKVTQYMRSAVVAAAAGVFVLMGVILALIGGAWLLYYYLPGATFAYFWGFFAMAVLLFLLGALAGLLAGRLVKRASPPVPEMTIDEARKIRETVSSGSEAAVGAAAPGSSAGLPGAGGGASPPAGGDGDPGSEG